MKKINWVIVLLAAMMILLIAFLIYSILPEWERDVKILKEEPIFCVDAAEFESSPYRNDVRLANLGPCGEIVSPYSLRGEARGGWYFEASLPIKLFDATGNLLTESPATALSDWMTDQFVAFEVTLNFIPATETGTLIIAADNPSGLPENAKQIALPVRFNLENKAAVGDGHDCDVSEGYRWCDLKNKCLRLAEENCAPLLAKVAQEKLAFEQYLRASISLLSPKKEVLGGKFMVGKIDYPSDNSALIEYDDGHILLHAAVDFIVDNDGVVQIQKFLILPEEEPKK